MDGLHQLLSWAKVIAPTAVAVTLVLIVLGVAHRIAERRWPAGEGYRFRQQGLMLTLTALGLFVVILVIPVGDVLRGQLLSLIGIVLSAGIALSSTTFLGNALASVMLRATKSFRMGDFVRVGDHFGRVSERGLFHTEIQTEDGDLTTLPNLFLVTNPVTTVRASGTVISATVSLGYDVPQVAVKKALTGAVEAAGLVDPFVHVVDLGDFSITYRAAGVLKEVTQLLSTRSRLRTLMLDQLHHDGIEIVSPNFMNTRSFAPESRFIPKEESQSRAAEQPAGKDAEEVIFDKADRAASKEQIANRIEDLKEQAENVGREAKSAGEGASAESLRGKAERLDKQRERLEAQLQQTNNEDE